jgi:Zn-dependent protease with chaperone function
VILVTAATFVGFALLALPGLMHPVGRRLRPGPWGALSVAALCAGAALVVISALLVASPLVFTVLGFTTLARACEQMLGQLSPNSPYAAILASALAISICLLGARAVRHARRVRELTYLEAGVGARHGHHGPYELIVLPDNRPFALSVAGPDGSGQVLVSEGLVQSLSPSEFDVVCAHEAAHLRLFHRRYLVLSLAVEAAFWFWPPVKKSAWTLEVALERRADEVAAGTSSNARITLRSALMAVAGITPLPGLAAFAAVDTLMERFGSLGAPPRRPSMLWWPIVLLPGLVLAMVAVYGLTRWGQGAYCIASMPGRCPLR